MTREVINQAVLFGQSCIMGACIIAVYDILRIIRRIRKHGKISVAIEDILFWILQIIIIFSFIFRENDGTIRFYIMFGISIGAIVYEAIIGRFLVKYLSLLLDKCIRYLLKALKFILKPFRIVLSNIKKRVIRWTSGIRQVLKTIKARRRRGQVPDENAD
ncbi:MAG: spore cortex biosynthesis protein YabQ [Eubacterium sp.]